MGALLVFGRGQERGGGRAVPVAGPGGRAGGAVQDAEHVAQLLCDPGRRRDRPGAGGPGPGLLHRARGGDGPGAAQTRGGAGLAPGLGLLPVRTHFGPDKVLARPQWALADGTVVEGYEIHHGVVTRDAGEPLVADEGCRAGAVAGTVWHGLLENDAFRPRPPRSGSCSAATLPVARRRNASRPRLTRRRCLPYGRAPAAGSGRSGDGLVGVARGEGSEFRYAYSRDGNRAWTWCGPCPLVRLL
jgi:hypothetical protein